MFIAREKSGFLKPVSEFSILLWVMREVTAKTISLEVT